MLAMSILDNLKGGPVQITCWGLLLIWELWAMLLMGPLHPYNLGTKVWVVRCMGWEAFHKGIILRRLIVLTGPSLAEGFLLLLRLQQPATFQMLVQMAIRLVVL